MDLYSVETLLRPQSLANVPDWEPDCAWLAGGTWMFSEPQPHTRVLVDLSQFGWSEIVETEAGIDIGATCTLAALLAHPWRSQWAAMAGWRGAIDALAASWKVVNVATVGGNLCLALSVGTLAPLAIALDAIYELWQLDGTVRQVAAPEFQRGHRQTALQPGEVLRKVIIPARSLSWQVNYQRMGIAANDPALVLVAAALDPETQTLRCGVGACVAAPQLLTFDRIPNREAIAAAVETLTPQIQAHVDGRSSAEYRQQLVRVALARACRFEGGGEGERGREGERERGRNV